MSLEVTVTCAVTGCGGQIDVVYYPGSRGTYFDPPDPSYWEPLRGCQDEHIDQSSKVIDRACREYASDFGPS
jgi:hypothetical protein